MSLKALTPINVPWAAADPTTPTLRAGDLYANSGTGALRLYNGAAWANVSTGGAGTPASTVVAETGWGQGTTVGTSTNYAREDHSHGTAATPATSVAGRTGAVTLTAADIGTGTFPGTYTFSGNITVNPSGAPGSVTIADGSITKQSGSGFNMNSSLTVGAVNSSGAVTGTSHVISGGNTISAIPGSYGSMAVNGAPNGWAGIAFTSTSNNQLLMMQSGGYGAYDQSGGWHVYWSGGTGEYTLQTGIVPAAKVSAGTFSGGFSFSGAVINSASGWADGGGIVYSLNHPPPYPVTSVNGNTGAVTASPPHVSSGTTSAGATAVLFTYSYSVSDTPATLIGPIGNSNTCHANTFPSGTSVQFLVSGGTSGTVYQYAKTAVAVQ